MDSVGAVLLRVSVMMWALVDAALGGSTSIGAWLTLARWLAWTCDAIDFFSVTLSVERLVEQFPGKTVHDIVRLLSPIYGT